MATFDWKSLIGPAVSLGSKVIGDKVAPAPDLMNAKSNQQSVQMSAQQQQLQNQIQADRIAQSNKIRQVQAPGLFTNLGIAPDKARQLAMSMFGSRQRTPGGGMQPSGTQYAPGSTQKPQQSSGQPGLGSKIGGAALGIGTSLAPSIIGAIGSGAGDIALTGGAGTLAGGGLGGALGALASNPFTWAAAGGLAAGIIWRKSQAHPEADTWVQGEQNPFDSAMAGIDKAVQSGQLPPEEAQETKQQNVQRYLGELQNFAAKGGDKLQVAKQAAATFRQHYGDPAQYGVQLAF